MGVRKLGQDRTEELKTALRQRFAAFEASNDRQNRVTAVNSVVQLADELLARDAEIPERREQQQRDDVRQAAEQGEVTRSLAAGPCVFALLIVVGTVIWGSTPWWTLLIGVPAMLGLAGFLVSFGDVTRQRIANDPQAHVVINRWIAGLATAVAALYVLAAVVWPTHVASWSVPAGLGLVAVLIVQARRPEPGEQPYRPVSRS